MKRILLLLLAVFSFTAVSAQAIKDLRINEILVKNVDSYADDHAHKVGWIELFNSGYSQINIAGVHIRLIQGSDTITYRVPKTDSRTAMGPQGYIVFFADGSSNKGTFHTNFELDVTDSVKWASLVGKNDRLEILDQSGQQLIDFIEYDVNTQRPDVSYGRLLNEDDEIVHTYLTGGITPMQSNETIERMPKNEKFRQEDPSGIIMALIAMSVVFTALICLYLVFKFLGKYMHSSHSRKIAANESAKQAAQVVAVAKSSDDPDNLQGETIAAIALALRLYENDIHDNESNVVTINRVARLYSPWNSKIYSLRQLPNRK